ncbi:MAG TPA: TetR family transcriptional regulator [Alphaproteobacteria bacterium]|nr:TetR family transcriptional regulator [Alphaproteobacteria bacterium]
MPRRSSRAKSRHAHAAEKKICDAGLSLAVRHGWDKVTLEQIARAVKIPAADVRKRFADKNQVLAAIVHNMGTPAGAKRAQGTPHDQLFEAMMARFDALQEHRAGVLAVCEAVRRDPALVRYLIPAQWRAIGAIAATAGLAEMEGSRRPLTQAALLGIYYWALCGWMRDRTPDMAKTMAGLDRGLRVAGKVAAMMGRRI